MGLAIDEELRVSSGSVEVVGSVLISTGLVDNASCPLLGRELVGALCAGVLVEGWSDAEVAITGVETICRGDGGGGEGQGD